jgi:hypothetical protein
VKDADHLSWRAISAVLIGVVVLLQVAPYCWHVGNCRATYRRLWPCPHPTVVEIDFRQHCRQYIALTAPNTGQSR